MCDEGDESVGGGLSREAPRTPYPVRGLEGLKPHLEALSHRAWTDRKALGGLQLHSEGPPLLPLESPGSDPQGRPSEPESDQYIQHTNHKHALSRHKPAVIPDLPYIRVQKGSGSLRLILTFDRLRGPSNPFTTLIRPFRHGTCRKRASWGPLTGVASSTQPGRGRPPSTPFVPDSAPQTPRTGPSLTRKP